MLAQRFVYRDVLLAALLINLFALAFPMFSMNVYDRVVPNNAVETLWALAIGVTLVLLADFGLRMLRSRFVDEASARIDVELSARLMERVLGMRLEHRPESVGSFASNLRGFEQVRDFIAVGHGHRADRPAVRAAVRVRAGVDLAAGWRSRRWWSFAHHRDRRLHRRSSACTNSPRPPTAPARSATPRWSRA